MKFNNEVLASKDKIDKDEIISHMIVDLMTLAL